jgi:hypothetical protein
MLKIIIVTGAVVVTSTLIQGESPRLGGVSEAFAAVFGQPVRSSGDIVAFQKCPGRTAIARWNLMIEHGRVIAITRNACEGETLSIADARQEATRFMPADATSPTRFVSSDGWPAQRRRSTSLAKALPAPAFQSCEGTVPPGTFSYVLSPERRSWTLTVGTCP